MNINNFSDYSMNSSDKEYVVKAEKAIEWIYLGDIFVAVWNKIYKMSFLKDNHILFDEKIWYGEGMLFNIDCLQFVDKVAVGEKSVYHQVSNPNSAMRKFNVESNLCGIRSLEIQKDHWKKSNPAIVDAWNYHRRAFNLSIARGLLKSNMEKEYQELYNSCIHNLRSHLWVSLKVPISLALILAQLPLSLPHRNRELCSISPALVLLIPAAAPFWQWGTKPCAWWGVCLLILISSVLCGTVLFRTTA